MQLFDRTFKTSEHNLACDEALLEFCENGYDKEILRFWEPKQHFIVMGLSGKTDQEVNLSACHKRQIPIFRRPSGGGTVLQGPGCLNYSLILKINHNRPIETIANTNRYIMQQHQQALESLLNQTVNIQGSTDLALGTLKFSGNAQRRNKFFLLFHGTFLLNLNLDLMNQLLPIPNRQPIYRKNRSHTAFLTHFPVSAQPIKNALIKTWGASELLAELPTQKIEELVIQKYMADDWNFKF